MLINLILLLVSFFFVNFGHSESYIKANSGISWDKNSQIYSANGEVEFRNDEIEAYSDRITAKYVIENGKEVFNIVDLYEDVKIFYQGEVFTADEAIYFRSMSIINLYGNVTVTSPDRFLSGDELVVDLDKNTRVLKTNGEGSIAEALIKDE